MPKITSYYMTDGETAKEYITDYSPSGLEALAAAEERGAILRAVYDDGTEEQVKASQVSNPNVATVERLTLGDSGGTRKMAAQSSVWTGTVNVGNTALRFESGLLVGVTVGEGR